MSGHSTESLANAILGVDTLWGGDVMSASGTGRFIADSWFSDQPLPVAYTHSTAERVRRVGGVGAQPLDREAIDAYLAAVDVHGAVQHLKETASGKYLTGLALCFEVMWDLAMEILGKGPAVPYERCVRASIDAMPAPSQPEARRARVEELLGKGGYQSVEAWRRQRRVPMASVRALGEAFIARFDQLCARNLGPFLPAELHNVPRANIRFLPIKDAWFSGSMNYLGRARQPDGLPEYEATYEINSSLDLSVPEFAQLISHEVVPGHVTTFAYLQNLFVRKLVGFEASIPTMNTRAAALYEGIANNAILMAYGVTEIHQLPDEDLQLGVLLALLQDDAKNQSSFLTWNEHRSQADVMAILQRDFLVTEERASKLSGAWGRHPLLGRMYLPAYRAGTEKVADLRRRYSPARLLPVLYGCKGLVDITTIENAL